MVAAPFHGSIFPGEHNRFRRYDCAVIHQQLIPGQRVAESQPGSTSMPATHQILLVDDSEDSAASLGMLLETRGHHVEIAADGPAARERVRHQVPDVVILDIGLPGMSGFEVAREFRSMPALNRTLLIALTGHGGPEDRARCRAAGFDHHFTKPLDFPALDRLLTNTRSRSPAAE
jgi:two-component system OmpR family response regulator